MPKILSLAKSMMWIIRVSLGATSNAVQILNCHMLMTIHMLMPTACAKNLKNFYDIVWNQLFFISISENFIFTNLFMSLEIRLTVFWSSNIYKINVSMDETEVFLNVNISKGWHQILLLEIFYQNRWWVLSHEGFRWLYPNFHWSISEYSIYSKVFSKNLAKGPF